MKILVMIPAYNEQESIMNVINEIKKNYSSAEYVVINDCSKDNTKTLLKENRAEYIDLPFNLGIGGGVQTGYLYALENDYDVAIQVDGDGQHDTVILHKMVDILEHGEADIVIGSRFIEKQGFLSTPLRRMGILFLSKIIKLTTGKKIYDVTSGLRAVNRKLIKLYADEYPVDYPEPEAIVRAAMEGYCIKEIPVCMKEREHGESSIHFRSSVYYMIKVSLAIFLCRFANKQYYRQSKCVDKFKGSDKKL